MAFARIRAAGYVFLAACLYDGQVALASRPDGLQGSLAADPGPGALAELGRGPKLSLVPDEYWKLECDEKPVLKHVERFHGVYHREGYKCKVTCSTADVPVSYVFAYEGVGLGHERAVMENMTGESAYVLSSVVLDRKESRRGGSYVLTDYFSGGMLKDELEDLTERWIAAYFWQLVKGMQDMHDQNLVHTNINLQNVFVHCEDTNHCYAALAEFEYACRTDEPYKAPKISWTKDELDFRAPEVQGAKTCLPSYDVWSMGVLLHYLLFRKYPSFEKGKPREPQIKAAVEAYEKDKKTDDIKPEVAQKVQEILEKALAEDPAKRIAGPDLLEEAKQLLKVADADLAEQIVDKVPTEYGARKPAPKCLNVFPDGPHCGTGKLEQSRKWHQESFFKKRWNDLTRQREHYSWRGFGCGSDPADCVRCACDDPDRQTHFEFLLKSC